MVPSSTLLCGGFLCFVWSKIWEVNKRKTKRKNLIYKVYKRPLRENKFSEAIVFSENMFTFVAENNSQTQ